MFYSRCILRIAVGSECIMMSLTHSDAGGPCGFFLFDTIKLHGGWERTTQRNGGDKYFPVGKHNDFFFLSSLDLNA